MIRTANPKPGNHNQVAYERAFAEKFALAKGLPNYDLLESFAQQCIDLHCGDSLNGISARVYMDKIIEMSDEEFLKFAKTSSKDFVNGKCKGGDEEV